MVIYLVQPNPIYAANLKTNCGICAKKSEFVKGTPLHCRIRLVLLHNIIKIAVVAGITACFIGRYGSLVVIGVIIYVFINPHKVAAAVLGFCFANGPSLAGGAGT